MWQPILMIAGYLMSILGLAMLIPAGYDIYLTHKQWSPFISSAAISLFIGIMLFLTNRMPITKISLRQGYLITVISWVCLVFIAAIPLKMSGVFPHFIDAFFEAMSGLTSAGGTVLQNIEETPYPVLLWRSMLNGLGGIGIVIFAVALLPYLGIGGMQIFQRENSDSDDKFMPKFSYIAKRIIILYLFLLAACIISFKGAGMDWFDAINHGLTTTSTGGFSTKNASFGAFNSVSIEMIAVIFMLLSSLPMTFYIVLWQSRDFHNSRNIQVITFFKIIAVYTIAVTLFLLFKNNMNILQALRYAVFNVVSIVTTSGFSSTDYLQWGAWSGTFFLIFMFTGGCTGSTSGSIKIFRWQVFYAFLRKSLIGATEPNRVIPIKLGNYNIENSLVSSIFIFLSAYLVCLTGFTILLAISGLDFVTAFSSASACMTNTGPGFVAINGPAGNYAFLTPMAKGICCLAMLVGRLDVLTILVLFTKDFWRR
ncbi:MAG: TrkH family potassium uptake protein [Alphaproteobacteria bacterium]|nr:TrkH family potassium uptake protein [Alphaproteobacteria bacterium]